MLLIDMTLQMPFETRDSCLCSAQGVSRREHKGERICDAQQLRNCERRGQRIQRAHDHAVHPQHTPQHEQWRPGRGASQLRCTSTMALVQHNLLLHACVVHKWACSVRMLLHLPGYTTICALLIYVPLLLT